MHCLNLGVMQTLACEGLLHCMSCFAQSPGDDAAACLRHQFVAFKMWCRSHKIACSTRTFTPAQLHMKDDEFPWLGTKAYNTRVILAWLADSRSIHQIIQIKFSFEIYRTASADHEHQLRSF